ncbi:MAG: nucleotidyltransferase domain-containing protein [Actinomycetota bacterium]
MSKVAVQDRIRGALEGDPDVLVAYLFGSRTNGTASSLSDFDVAVLIDESCDLHTKHLELIDSIGAIVGSERADVVILNDAPVTLAYKVLKANTLLVSRDEKLRVDHWTKTVSRYLDMAPFRRILEAGLANRLKEGRFGRL